MMCLHVQMRWCCVMVLKTTLLCAVQVVLFPVGHEPSLHITKKYPAACNLWCPDSFKGTYLLAAWC
jgi:hypothetical protein